MDEVNPEPSKITGARLDAEGIGTKTGRSNPVISLSRAGIPVGKKYEKLFAREGWNAVFSPKAWVAHPVATGALFLNVTYGLSWEICTRAARRVAWSLGGAGSGGAVVGRTVGVKALTDGRVVVRASIPIPGGGSRLTEFTLCGEGTAKRLHALLGDGVEVDTSDGGTVLRPTPDRSVISPDGRIAKLSAYEVASVVDAQYRELDFSGEWVKEELGGGGRGTLSRREASLFVHRSTGQGVLVFRGTEPAAAGDWISNIGVTHGIGGATYKRAIRTAEVVRERVPDLIFAGHSRGGGMAQYVAGVLDGLAVTFNTVGLPSKLLGKLGQARHFVTRYDWVSNAWGSRRPEGGSIRGPLAVLLGRNQHFLGGARAVTVLRAPRGSRYSILELHSIEALRRGLREDPQLIDNPFSRGGEDPPTLVTRASPLRIGGEEKGIVVGGGQRAER